MRNFSSRSPHAADALLMGRAIKERWPIAQEYREAIIKRLVTIAVDKQSTRREATAAARALMYAEAQNQSDQHHEAGKVVHHDHVVTVDARRTRLLGIAQRLGLTGLDGDSGGERPEGTVSGVVKSSSNGRFSE